MAQYVSHCEQMKGPIARLCTAAETIQSDCSDSEPAKCILVSEYTFPYCRIESISLDLESLQPILCQKAHLDFHLLVRSAAAVNLVMTPWQFVPARKYGQGGR